MSNVKLVTKAAYDLPEFVRDEYTTFAAFIDAYHVWLDANQANIKTLSDIDTTLDSFVKNFRAEVDYMGISFPNIDERFLLRHIKKLYLSKGTEESYKTLFKLLFNKDVIVKYPYEMTLKSSDGKWEQLVSLFVEVSSGSAELIQNKVVKISNPATKRIAEVTVNNVKRRRAGGGVSTVMITSGGSGYTTPTVTLYGGNGTGAAAHAIVAGGAITSIIIDKPGDNYTIPPTIIVSEPTVASSTEFGASTVYELNEIVSSDGLYYSCTLGYTTGLTPDLPAIDSSHWLLFVEPVVVTSVQMLMMPDIYELNIEKNYYGIINVGDVIFDGEFQGKILPTINSFEILETGKDFRLGQTFDIDTLFGKGATVKVTKLSGINKGLAELKFIKYGYGYVSDFESSNVIPPNISQSTPYQGFSSSSFNHVGNFAASTKYEINDVVWSVAAYYRCIVEYTTNGTPTVPGSDATHWALYTGTEETRLGSFAEFAVADPNGGYVLKETLSTTPNYDYIWAASIVKDTQSLTWVSSVATVTTASPHGLSTGNTVVIAGVTPDAYNGTYVITVTGLSTFTYSLNVGSPGSATIQGTATTAYATNKVIKHLNNFYEATTTGIQGATPPTHTNGNVTHGGVTYLFLDSSDLYALNYAGDTLREFYSSNKYNGDPANAARIKFNTGAVCKYPGHYVNSDGMASDDVKLQDSFLYQKYSCVIQADEKLERYSDVVKSFVHPAGVALFGEYNISNEFSVKLKLEALLSIFAVRHADGVTAGHDELLGSWFEKMLEVSDSSYLLYGTQKDWSNITSSEADWKKNTIKVIQDDPTDFTEVQNIDNADNIFHFIGVHNEILDETTHPTELTNEITTIINDAQSETEIVDPDFFINNATMLAQNWARETTKEVNDESYGIIGGIVDHTNIIDPVSHWTRNIETIIDDPLDSVVIANIDESDNTLDVALVKAEAISSIDETKFGMNFVYGEATAINIDDIAGNDYVIIERDAVMMLFDDAYIRDHDINSTIVFTINSVNTLSDELNPTIDAGGITLNEYVTLLTDYVDSSYVSAPNQSF